MKTRNLVIFAALLISLLWYICSPTNSNRIHANEAAAKAALSKNSIPAELNEETSAKKNKIELIPKASKPTLNIINSGTGEIELIPDATGKKVTLVTQQISDTHVRLTVSFPTLQVSKKELADGNTYQSFSIPGTAHKAFGDGRPTLPVKTLMLRIPNGRGYTVLHSSAQTAVMNDVILEPAQPAQFMGETTELKFVKDDEFYASSTNYPRQAPVSSGSIGIRHKEFIQIQVFPLSYNPAKQNLEITPTIQVDVEIDESSENSRDIASLYSHSFEQLVSNGDFAFPAATATTAQALKKSLSANNKVTVPGEAPYVPVPVVMPGKNAPEKYMVIYGDQYENNAVFQAFLEWKRKKGYDVVTVKKSDIRVGGCNAIHISNYLKALNDAEWPVYLLLVGNEIPMYARKTSFRTKKNGDFYYSLRTYNQQVNEDWDDGVDPSLWVDEYPDCFIGRIPASSNDSLTKMLTKMMFVDRTPPMSSSHYNRSIFAGAKDKLLTGLEEHTDAMACYFEQAKFDTDGIDNSIPEDSNVIRAFAGKKYNAGQWNVRGQGLLWPAANNAKHSGNDGYITDYISSPMATCHFHSPSARFISDGINIDDYITIDNELVAQATKNVNRPYGSHVNCLIKEIVSETELVLKFLATREFSIEDFTNLTYQAGSLRNDGAWQVSEAFVTKNCSGVHAACAKLKEEWGRGSAFVSHMAHGYYDGWYWNKHGPPFYKEDAAALDSPGKFSFVIDAACLTAELGSGTNLTQALLENPNGGAYAMISSSEKQWGGAQDYLFFGYLSGAFTDFFSYFADHFDESSDDESVTFPAYADPVLPISYVPGKGKRLGQMWWCGKVYIMENWPADKKLDPDQPVTIRSSYENMYMQTLFGDPESLFHYSAPKQLRVEHIASLPLKENETISVDVTISGSPVNNALVSLYNSAMGIHEVQRTDASGQANFTVPLSLSGALSVTVSAEDSAPYESSIAIGSNDSPVFTVDSVILPVANPEVSYSIPIKNYASDVNGDVITFSKISGPEWVNVNAYGYLNFIPDVDAAGFHDIVIAVTDGTGGSDQATFTLEVVSQAMPVDIDSDGILEITGADQWQWLADDMQLGSFKSLDDKLEADYETVGGIKIPNLLYYWSFDNVIDGKTIDSVNGQTISLNDIHLEQGYMGKALHFDSVNDYGTIGQQSLAGDYTVSFAVKRVDSTSEMAIILNKNKSASIRLENWKHSQQFGLYPQKNFSYEAPVDQWIEVALVVSNKKTSLYIDGEFIQTVTWNGSLPLDTLGKPGYSMLGHLDELKVFDRALNKVEVKFIHRDNEERGEGLVIQRQPDGLISLSFGVEAGQSYRLEYSSDLINWIPWDEVIPISETAQSLEIIDNGQKSNSHPSTEPRRFYRLVEIKD